MRAKTLTVLLCLSVSGFNSLSAQQATTAPVTLTVTDQSGAGIPHLQVRIVPAPDPAPKMETDEKGKLSFDLKPGGYAFFARFSGFKPLATHFDVRATKELQTIPFCFTGCDGRRPCGGCSHDFDNGSDLVGVSIPQCDGALAQATESPAPRDCHYSQSSHERG